jgi:hypothetical protein
MNTNKKSSRLAFSREDSTKERKTEGTQGLANALGRASVTSLVPYLASEENC